MAQPGIVNTLLAAATIFNSQQQAAQQFAVQQEQLRQRAKEQEELQMIREQKLQEAERALDLRAQNIQADNVRADRAQAETERKNQAKEARDVELIGLRTQALKAQVDRTSKWAEVEALRAQGQKIKNDASLQSAIRKAEAEARKADLDLMKIENEHTYKMGLLDQGQQKIDQNAPVAAARAGSYNANTAVKTNSMAEKKAEALVMGEALPPELSQAGAVQMPLKDLEKIHAQAQKATQRKLSDMEAYQMQQTGVDPRTKDIQTFENLTKQLGWMKGRINQAMGLVGDTVYQASSQIPDGNTPVFDLGADSPAAIQAIIGGLQDGQMGSQLLQADEASRKQWSNDVAEHLVNARRSLGGNSNEFKQLSANLFGSLQNDTAYPGAVQDVQTFISQKR